MMIFVFLLGNNCVHLRVKNHRWFKQGALHINFIYTRNHHERNICFFLNILAQCSESAQIYKDLEADNFYFSRKLVNFGMTNTSGNSGFLFKFCLLATYYIIMFALKIHILSSRSTGSLWYRCHRQWFCTIWYIF